MDPAADLTSISHLLENSFIVEKLGAEYAWIGLNDHMHNREFLWSDNSVVEFLYWAPNQPDNLLFKQHCVQIYDKLSGEWDDEDCSVEKTFVCKLTGAA
ncbi:lectin BRA-3-like isoform X2 [Pollicipes pollicipes]|nr:lectin BRA-3-like isoform X2 [Pollicipes pollicipes]